MGFASGVVSGEDDNGTNCEPTLAGAGCACNAIGVIGKVTAGDACGVTACDPGVPGDCDSGFASGEAAVVPKGDACGAACGPVVESDCCNGAESGSGFPAGWSDCEVVCDVVVVVLFFCPVPLLGSGAEPRLPDVVGWVNVTPLPEL